MSLSSVVTMGYLPDAAADISLVTLMGYANGAEPPPPPPPDEEAPAFYGPALSPAERRRWFGGDDERRKRIFESPLAREVRRLAQERLRRIEIGLLPPDPTAEDKEEAAEVIAVQIERKIEAAPAPRSREDAKALAAKVASAVAADIKAEQARAKAEAKELANEEQEAILLLQMMMYTLE